MSLTRHDGVVELVQFALQGANEPAHRHQPDEEGGQDEERAHRPGLHAALFERHLLGKLVPVPEPGTKNARRTVSADRNRVYSRRTFCISSSWATSAPTGGCAPTSCYRSLTSLTVRSSCFSKRRVVPYFGEYHSWVIVSETRNPTASHVNEPQRWAMTGSEQ